MVLTRLAFFVLFCIFADARDKAKGDSCTLPDKTTGICKSFKDCPDAKQTRPEICGFEGKYPVICCKVEKKNKTEEINLQLTKSEQFCQKHYPPPPPFDPEHPVYAVFGGWNSLIAQFPHMAVLGYGIKSDIKWGCGGSLIGFRHILTAAHCTTSRELGDVKFVRLGDLDLNSTVDISGPQDFTVVKKTKHPDYRQPSKYQDIAILELDRDVEITTYVQPACLQIETAIAKNSLTATGWGRLEFGGETAAHLQVVYLDHVSHAKCNQEYSTESKNKLSLGIVDDWQLCAGKENADTCQGDSGGPLQIKCPNGGSCWQIVGVTSFGKACGISNSPGIYTRVSNYIDWIESIVWP